MIDKLRRTLITEPTCLLQINITSPWTYMQHKINSVHGNVHNSILILSNMCTEHVFYFLRRISSIVRHYYSKIVRLDTEFLLHFSVLLLSNFSKF